MEWPGPLGRNQPRQFFAYVKNLSRIKGFIKAPLNDQYIFEVTTDASFSLTINNKTIIDHFMSNRRKGHQGLPWGQVLKSNPYLMNSGSLYNFEMKYWRSDN